MLGIAKDYELMAERAASRRTAPKVDGVQAIPP
jgi:hypothetical protein